MREVLLFILLCLCLVGCSSVQTNDQLAKARQGAERGYQNLSARSESQHFCILGIRVSADGKILYVGVNAKNAGLLPGDKILAVDGNPVMNWREAREKIAKHSPNESVTLMLLRDGNQIFMECPCVDISETASATADALREASEGNWLGCSEKMEQMQRDYGPSPLAQKILLDCYNYYLLSQQKGPDRILATAVVKLTLLNIEEASSSKAALEGIRNDVLGQAEWLKRNNFPELAEEIHKNYDKALADLGKTE